MSYYDKQFTATRANQVMQLGDRRTRETIIRVLNRLPGDALDLAVDKCVFLSVGGAVEGQCRPRSQLDRDWLIFIEDQPRRLGLETLIAHEIAHAFLEHLVREPVPPEDEREREVQELLHKWGFAEEPSS
jgi:hypothetical protein